MIATSWTWLSRKPAVVMRMNCALRLELRDRRRADIAHRGAQAAGELVQDRADRAAIGHLALDALGHQLHLVLDVLLEVAVGRALRHRAERAHAAIALVGAALVEEHLARALVGAGEQRADHHAVGAGGDRLGEVAGILDAAVGDDRHVRALRPASAASRIGGELRHADAGDDAGGADRARPDADLDRVGAGVDQRLRALAGRDVAGDDRDLVGRALDAPDLLEHLLGMAVGGVDDEAVDARRHQQFGALEALVADGGGRGDAQAPVARPWRRADGRSPSRCP